MLAIAAAACSHSHSSRTAPDRNGRTVVTLLPDPDSGAVGAASVSNAAGSVELTRARASTTINGNAAPTPVKTLSESETRQLFNAAFSMLPMAPQHFTLHFQFNSDELTSESRALLPQVLNAAKGRPIPEVLIIGHTDRVGSATTNIALGLRRAGMIRKQLIDIGLDSSLVEVVSHGEADLLVKTADEVPEPLNRRVEITVR